jgi:hypothetical protein
MMTGGASSTYYFPHSVAGGGGNLILDRDYKSNISPQYLQLR